MQGIYQRKSTGKFDWNYYKKAQLGKRKCQNAELENLSPTKRIFYHFGCQNAYFAAWILKASATFGDGRLPKGTSNPDAYVALG